MIFYDLIFTRPRPIEGPYPWVESIEHFGGADVWGGQEFSGCCWFDAAGAMFAHYARHFFVI